MLPMVIKLVIELVILNFCYKNKIMEKKKVIKSTKKK